MRRICCLLLVLIALPLSAEIYLGGAGSSYFELTSINDSPEQWNSIQYLDFYLDAEGELFTLSLEPSLVYNWALREPQFQLNRAEVLFSPADFLSLKLGRFYYAPGTGTLFSPTGFFSATDYEKTLSGKLQKATLPADLIQIKFFFGDFYINLSAAPFHLPSILPAADSPWFPLKDIPQSIDITYPIIQTLPLLNLRLNDYAAPEALLTNTSLSMEWGFSSPLFDFSFLIYNGDDKDMLLEGEMNFPQGLFGGYDIYLTPLMPRILALGANLSTGIGPLTFWADSAYTVDKTFMTLKLSSSNFKTKPLSRPYLEYVFGAGLDLDTLFLILEYKNCYVMPTEETLIKPMLSSILSALVTFRLFDYTTTLQGVGLLSLEDYSLGCGVSLTYAPSEELEFGFTLPLYYGGPDTLFGQFSVNHIFSGNVVYKY